MGLSIVDDIFDCHLSSVVELTMFLKLKLFYNVKPRLIFLVMAMHCYITVQQIHLKSIVVHIFIKRQDFLVFSQFRLLASKRAV